MKTPNQPKPIGGSLSKKDIESLAELVFKRYYYEYGIPQWNDEQSKQIRKMMIKRVKEVADAMEILGFTFSKVESDILKNRNYLTTVRLNENESV